jgi:hypothetical protein
VAYFRVLTQNLLVRTQKYNIIDVPDTIRRGHLQNASLANNLPSLNILKMSTFPQSLQPNTGRVLYNRPRLLLSTKCTIILPFHAI